MRAERKDGCIYLWLSKEEFKQLSSCLRPIEHMSNERLNEYQNISMAWPVIHEDVRDVVAVLEPDPQDNYHERNERVYNEIDDGSKE